MELSSGTYRKTASGTERKCRELPSVKTQVKNGGREGDSPFDVDLNELGRPTELHLRNTLDAVCTEPPFKKPRGESRGCYVKEDLSLIGHQQIGMRSGHSCWIQGKPNAVVEDEGKPQSGSFEDNACDRLGRPLYYLSLSAGLKTRNKILDERSKSNNAVEAFKTTHIENALRHTGILSQNTAKLLLTRAKQEHDKRLLNKEQLNTVVTQIMNVTEVASKIIIDTSSVKEFQQVQMTAGKCHMPHVESNRIPNPSILDNDLGWTKIGPVSRTTMGKHASVSFAVSKDSPRETSNTTPPSDCQSLPFFTVPSNPFVEALRSANMENFVPKAMPINLQVAKEDEVEKIPIDEVSRDLRFYQDEVLVMTGVNADEPRDLTFQNDGSPRTILIDGNPLEIYLDVGTKHDCDCGKSHVLRIGSPGRELCIDDQRQGLLFNGQPKTVFIDGISHTFQYTSPPPKVLVGVELRHDLCAGRVTLFIDYTQSESVYLDEKLQTIVIAEEPVILQFRNNFKTVSLNGTDFQLKFGSSHAFSITLPSMQKHLIFFNTVSRATQAAIRTYISKNISRYKLDSSIRNNNRWGNQVNFLTRTCAKGKCEFPAFQPTELTPLATEVTSNTNQLSLLSNITSPNVDVLPPNIGLHPSYDFKPSMAVCSSIQGDMDKTLAPINMENLFANLVKVGLIPATSGAITGRKSPIAQAEIQTIPISITEQMITHDLPECNVRKTSPVPSPTSLDVTFADNLKIKRNSVIAELYTGLQCAQCGVRFITDAAVNYPQHLDWHFRLSRKQNATATKARCRKWYYERSDWIQLDETNDLEEKNVRLFKTQRKVQDNDSRSPSPLDQAKYTVLSSSHPGAVCPHCHESFECFFDQEREEWRLRNAKLDEYEGGDKLCHPICHQEYLNSLVEEDTIEEVNAEDSKDNKKSENQNITTQSPEEDEEADVLIV